MNVNRAKYVKCKPLSNSTTSCAGMTCHARRKFLVPIFCNIFSILSILKYNLCIFKYYFLIISNYRTSSKRKRRIICIRSLVTVRGTKLASAVAVKLNSSFARCDDFFLAFFHSFRGKRNVFRQFFRKRSPKWHYRLTRRVISGKR